MGTTAVEQQQVLLPGRSQLELLTAQIEAIDAWHRAHGSDGTTGVGTLSREMRLDLNRQAEARARERQALVARADQQLRESGALSGRARTRAVLAHRSAWFRDAVAQQLQSRGVRVVGAFEDGADAAGTVVVEQPDLVLLEDRLPTLPGPEVLSRIRTFSPATVVGVQCLDDRGARALQEAGAQVFPRRVPPAEIADQLLSCLTAGREPAGG